MDLCVVFPIRRGGLIVNSPGCNPGGNRVPYLTRTPTGFNTKNVIIQPRQGCEKRFLSGNPRVATRGCYSQSTPLGFPIID